MLGLKIGILLVITIFSFLIVSEANAESFLIQFDKSKYFTNDSISITGKIYEIKMPVIAMRIYDADGKILSANNLEIESDGSFTKTFILNSPFYKKSGEYKVKFDYGKISQNNYFLIDNQNKTKFSNESVDALNSSNESLKPEILSLKTEKSRYTNNDIIVIYGSVSTLDPPTVLIGIYDTFGPPLDFILLLLILI